MEVFLASLATGEYESMASSLIDMGATSQNVDSKAFARDLEKIFSSIQASIYVTCATVGLLRFMFYTIKMKIQSIHGNVVAGLFILVVKMSKRLLNSRVISCPLLLIYSNSLSASSNYEA